MSKKIVVILISVLFLLGYFSYENIMLYRAKNKLLSEGQFSRENPKYFMKIVKEMAETKDEETEGLGDKLLLNKKYTAVYIFGELALSKKINKNDKMRIIEKLIDAGMLKPGTANVTTYLWELARNTEDRNELKVISQALYNFAMIGDRRYEIDDLLILLKEKGFTKEEIKTLNIIKIEK